MCVVVAKHIKGHGWVLCKNRDRNYKADIGIRKSFRRNMERLYIWDYRTVYTEGLNEHGVAILSASVMVKEDEQEGVKQATKEVKATAKPRKFYSPDGLRIRTALFEKTAEDAVKKLIELQIPGNTLVASKDNCYLIESSMIDESGAEKYVHKVIEIPKEKFVVRTNHGILLPWTGYSAEIEDQKASRESSEVRYEKVVKAMKDAETIEDILSACSIMDDENPQLNPLRMDVKRNAMRTTGQIVLVPGEHTLHYRPIWCDVSFDLDNNSHKERTFFEIISTRKLFSSLKESMKSFGEFLKEDFFNMGTPRLANSQMHRANKILASTGFDGTKEFKDTHTIVDVLWGILKRNGLDVTKSRQVYLDIMHGKPKNTYGLKYVSSKDEDELENAELVISMKKVKSSYEVISYIQ